MSASRDGGTAASEAPAVVKVVSHVCPADEHRHHSPAANGEEFEYEGEFELEEPFSESDEDEEALAKRPPKPHLSLPMPRRRIRTLSGTVPPIGYSPVWGGATMCLQCLEFFELPNQTEQYTAHLLEKHKVVISEIEVIVDPKRYVEYWRHRFAKEPIEKIFPLVKPLESDPLFGKVDGYFLMSERVPEDQKCRQRLAMRRLEEVLSCQQREREDKEFRRQCLFCRYTAKGNRAKLIHHLYTIHHLNLGSPDNLVFVMEYLDVLKAKIEKNECLYCEKQFADHPTLMEHMRKKQHREVNPKNHYYDRFYVINYLELGKRWLEVLAEDFEDSTFNFLDSDEEEEEETWNEWQEDNADEDATTVVCLFCDEALEAKLSFLEHLKEAHHFDLRGLFREHQMDFYDRVKFVNFVRKMSHNCICFVCSRDDLRSWTALRKHLSEGDHLLKIPEKSKWSGDEFLVPTYENDNLLCVLEDDEEEDDWVAPVVPEDPPELGDALKSEELREQLK